MITFHSLLSRLCVQSLTVLLFSTLMACGEPKARLPKTNPQPQVDLLVAAAQTKTETTVARSTFFTGTTEAHRRSALTSRIGGLVRKVHVRDGDTVKAGQAIVSFDTEDFRLRFAQAEAGLKAAQVQYDATKIEWDRLKKLREDRAVPQSQFDMVDAKLEGSKAGVAQAEALAGMARKALGDTTLTAPYDAIIIKRFVNEGEYATAMPPTVLVAIEETHPLDIRFQLPASEMNRVKIGTKAHVRFPATGQELDATVTRVVPSVDARTRTFAAVLEVSNPDHALWAGMFVDIRLLADSAEDSRAQVTAQGSAGDETLP